MTNFTLLNKIVFLFLFLPIKAILRHDFVFFCLCLCCQVLSVCFKILMFKTVAGWETILSTTCYLWYILNADLCHKVIVLYTLLSVGEVARSYISYVHPLFVAFTDTSREGNVLTGMNLLVSLNIARVEQIFCLHYNMYAYVQCHLFNHLCLQNRQDLLGSSDLCWDVDYYRISFTLLAK